HGHPRSAQPRPGGDRDARAERLGSRGVARSQATLDGVREAGALALKADVTDPASVHAECIVHERYRDSEAPIEHAAHLGDLNAAILATGSVSGALLGE